MEKSFPAIILLLTLSGAPTQWDLAPCRDIVMWPECDSTWAAGEYKDIQAIWTLPSRQIDVTSVVKQNLADICKGGNITPLSPHHILA